jgi:hypothetical protein
MIKLVEQWLESSPHIGEIHYPAGILADRAANVYFDSKRVPVHAGAFMPFGNTGQAMSGLDLKNAENIHGRIVPPGRWLRNSSGISLAGFESHT